MQRPVPALLEMGISRMPARIRDALTGLLFAANRLGDEALRDAHVHVVINPQGDSVVDIGRFDQAEEIVSRSRTPEVQADAAGCAEAWRAFAGLES